MAKRINILTHNGIFHADEITACALLKVFYATNEDSVSMYRLPHQTDVKKLKDTLEELDADVFVVDIGREFDPDNKLFDHHQFRGGKSSAGMVYEWLLNNDYLPKGVEEELENVIRMIDKNDVGEEEAPVGSIPWMLSYFNAIDNVYGKEQENNFIKAVNVMYKFLKGLKEKYSKINEAYEKIKDAKILKEKEFDAIITNEYVPFWNYAVHNLLKEKDLVLDFYIWYDKIQGKWKAQNIPENPNSFKPLRKRIMYSEPLPKGVEFVHKGNFFMVADSYDALIDYLNNHAG